MKFINKTVLIMGLCSMLPSYSYPGVHSSGGGHGLYSPNGEIITLDLSEEVDQSSIQACEDIEKEEIQLFQDDRTKSAARKLSAQLAPLENRFPAFYRALVFVFSEKIKWHMTKTPLLIFPDHEIRSGERFNLIQLARQCGRGNVIINDERFSRLTQESQVALLAHEVFLAKLGLDISRESLRQAVRAIFDLEENRAEALAAVLDPVAPQILLGKYVIYTELNKLHGIARIQVEQLGQQDHEDHANLVGVKCTGNPLEIPLDYETILDIKEQFPWKDRWATYRWWWSFPNNERKDPYPSPFGMYLGGCAYEVSTKESASKWAVAIQDALRFTSVGLPSFLDNPRPPTSYRIFINNVLQISGTYEFKDGRASTAIPIDLW